jgi:hypothetical protein
MKLFCSYACTGEDVDAVTSRMQLVVDTLRKSGHEPYCPLFDAVNTKLYANGDMPGVFQNAFGHLMKQDALVAIISSPRKSEGQLIEIGAALSHNIPVYLFQHESAQASLSYIPQIVSQTHTWTTQEELVSALTTI